VAIPGSVMIKNDVIKNDALRLPTFILVPLLRRSFLIGALLGPADLAHLSRMQACDRLHKAARCASQARNSHAPVPYLSYSR